MQASKLDAVLTPLVQELPSYEDRVALLARDPLACAEGFQTLVLLALRHLFGVRYCRRCPDCAQSDTPCTDIFGSITMATGSIFGRIDAIYGSIECQKCGTLHLHLQAFLQCYHQFTPLSELQRLNKEPLLEMLRRYSDYSGHVRRMVYCNHEAWEEEREAVEAAWPEYRDCALMSSRPTYQLDTALEPTAWRTAYLAADVEELQKRKQHHVHLPTGPNGERRPLHHCQDAKDPTKCKSGFPRDTYLTDSPILICPQEAQKRGMPHKGKRSMVGMPWGPCNDPNVNGTHPGLLAGLRCNSDVQLPYRFPILPATHSEHCSGECDKKMRVWDLVRDAQINQAAQAGYAADYQNKRLPIAMRECKEWMKAQGNLAEDLKDQKLGYVGARVAKRIITDFSARGVCRSAVECTNLTLQASNRDPTTAETIKTAPATDLALAHPLQLLDAIRAGQPWPAERRRQQTDRRSYTDKKLTDCPPWTLYGARGRSPQARSKSATPLSKNGSCASISGNTS